MTDKTAAVLKDNGPAQLISPETPVVHHPSRKQQSTEHDAERSSKREALKNFPEIAACRRRNTSLRFQFEIPSSLREQMYRNITGLYCRVLSCAQWSKENCALFVPFHKQAALVLAANGYSIDKTVRARMSHPIESDYVIHRLVLRSKFFLMNFLERLQIALKQGFFTASDSVVWTKTNCRTRRV